MKKNLLKFSFVLGIAGILTGCDLESLDLNGGGDEFQSVDNAKVIVEENADTELAVVKVFENVNNYGISEEGNKSASLVDSLAPIVSWSFFPEITMTLDFTPVPDASGKIHATFNSMNFIVDSSGFVPTAGLSVEVTFEDYSNEGSGMDGMLTLGVVSNDASGIKYTMVSDGFLTISENGESYDWSCDQSILWSEGFATYNDDSDDSYVLDGSSVQVRDTVTNETLITALVIDANCDWNPSGILAITADKGGDLEYDVSIDFSIGEDYDPSTGEGSTGACDDWVLLNSTGNPAVVDLPIKFSSF